MLGVTFESLMACNVTDPERERIFFAVSIFRVYKVKLGLEKQPKNWIALFVCPEA